MKKISIFFLIVIVTVAGVYYMFINYKAKNNKIKQANMQFESYYNKEIYGTELTSIINKAMDSNNGYEVEKDNKGNYIENESDSIKIDIKMKDNDKIYTMETLYNGGMINFVKYYSSIQFKCIKIEYHKATGKIKYLLFEQITE